jgi:hypothetical protein
MNRMHGLLKGHRARTLRPLIVQVVVVGIDMPRKLKSLFGKCVCLNRNIFAQKNATGAQMRQKRFHCGDLLISFMAAVIDHDIEFRNIFFESLPERSIGLVANKDLRLRVLVTLADSFLVYAINMDAWPKVVFPHLQAAAGIDADFEHVNVFAHELREVPVVDLEIMSPLPKATPFDAGIKKCSNVLRERWGRHRGKTELPFDLAQDQHTAIRRQLSTIKRCSDRFSADRLQAG